VAIAKVPASVNAVTARFMMFPPGRFRIIVKFELSPSSEVPANARTNSPPRCRIRPDRTTNRHTGARNGPAGSQPLPVSSSGSAANILAVEAPNAKAAEAAVIAEFDLSDEQQQRLVVQEREQP
jgi:hypothetical protein